MGTSQTCPQCNGPLPANAAAWLCPRCLLGQAAAKPETPTITVSAAPVAEQPGERLGRYKLLQKLGEGGMGAVWMADQLEPVRRRVALKILKAGMDTREVILRFEAERQALALMDHPNIARVFDAGASASGRPYFVMELVPGVRLTDYCDQNRLSVRERLQLFIQVCHAVQHAHQKGIIHRDLKPSNILVTLHDGVPVPKVIDFGIAKATAQPLTEQTLFTQLGAVLGTPAYMSPEQTELSGLDIDTRSDIYSLGVLLYQLLTGHPPFEPKDLMAGGLAEMARIIREQEPPRPSTRLTTLERRELAALAQRHGTEAPRLVHLVRGDLDWIVMKCLEKDRRRRYDTANGLAADIGRHLASEPVEARPPSAAYRMRKFVRRNRLGVLAGGAVVMALLAGVVGTASMARRAIAQRDRASKAEAAAEKRRKEALEQTAVKGAVLDFLMRDLLRQADSQEQASLQEKPNPDLTVKEAVRRAAERIGDRFQGKPAEEASIRRAIGLAFRGIGEAPLAVPQLERSLELVREVTGPDSSETCSAMSSLADAYTIAGQLRQAVALGEEALRLTCLREGTNSDAAMSARIHLSKAYAASARPRDAIKTLEAAVNARSAAPGLVQAITLKGQLMLAMAYSGNSQHREAIALFEKVLAWQRANLPTNHLELAFTLVNLGTCHGHLRAPERARVAYEEALPILRNARGAEDPDTLGALEGLAHTLGQTGRRAEALPLIEEVLRGKHKRLGARHPDTLRSEARLAAAEFDLGRKSEGIERLERVLAAEKSSPDLGPDHRVTLESMSLLGRLYWDNGRLSNALPLFKDAFPRARQTMGPTHSVTFHLQYNLGCGLVESGQSKEGSELLSDLMRSSRANGDDPSEFVGYFRAYVNSHERRGRFPIAEVFQRLVIQGLQADPKTNPLEIATDVSRLGRNLVEQGRFAEAEVELNRALAVFTEQAPDHWRRFVTQAVLGSALAGRQQFQQAESLLLKAHEKLEAMTDPRPTYRRDVLSRLARFYTAWDAAAPEAGHAAKAAEYRRKLAEFDARQPGQP